MEIRIRATGAVMLEDELRRWAKDNGGPSWDRTTEEVLEALGADVVFEGPQATGGTVYQFSMRQGVEQIDDKWYTKYVLGPIFTDTTDEEGNVTTAAEHEAAYKAQKDAEQAKAVRADRNKRLADSDWTQVADAPVDKAAWAAHRQALRDVTAQEGFPWNVQWPQSPV
jgi:hypothetical protein